VLQCLLICELTAPWYHVSLVAIIQTFIIATVRTWITNSHGIGSRCWGMRCGAHWFCQKTAVSFQKLTVMLILLLCYYLYCSLYGVLVHRWLRKEFY